jgi:hypothetical protein
MKPLAPPDYLIACVGNRVDSRCAEAMAQVASVLPYLSIRFVDSGWLSPSEIAAATLCWVVDADLSGGGIYEALRAGLPLLVPVERKDLRALCEGSGCGYSYETAGEAAERIAWILRSSTTQSSSERATLATRHATAGDR